ncbi:PREDICTED: hydrocephalus-inducing protein homolog [Nipponia nippon]|uniref:hydrocephalus-inducing protein homolog n=1 Tax=Nipponia nippon TaxID=128390 RepID=UPI000510BFF5|nr:PREDICTED: hydrocephalus-inducing protein homolog [Nipponia nippon]
MADGFQSKVVAPRNPKLIREAEECVTLTPSAFLKEMSLTTEQRLASTREMRRPQIIQLLDMSETSHQKFSAVDLEQSLFQPFPSEVVFQNYVPCEVYEVPLILRNNDKVPRLVKVVLESSPYFKLISPNAVCRKVAPGMPSTFRILFTPEENKDYFHQLTCITEREKFIVPIRAIGARAILDFPDQLNFSVCPVKYSTQKTLLVRNIGNREARYCISTQSPFSVDASIGTLGIGDTMQVTVEFHPLKTGDHSRSLIVHYDTGEDIHTSLYGAAVDVNIRLDRNSLTVEKTYLTLSNHRSVVIHNRSEIIAHFQWKAFVTQEEEDQQKLRLCRRLQRQEEDETDYFLKECAVDPTLRERLSLLSRTFQNQRAKVQGDSMLFSDDIFTFEPVEGDVWPNSSAEINVIFKPQEARVYQQTVYCDISGRETRLPLRIKGEGIGPRLRFSFDQLDIGKVFVGSAHSYEVILFNKGVIDALFNLVPPDTALGSCFTFLPEKGIILPDGLQVIQISFSSTILGQFTEEFRFSVNGSAEPVTLTIRGCVIGPTFHFNVPSLRFGDVSFGFPRTLSCRLTNTSLVPMTFNLRIPGDGSGEPSVTSFVQMSDITRPSWRKGAQGRVKPTEFTVMPCRGTIRSQGLLDIQVTLCSNTVKRYELALVVDVDGVGKEVLALPLTARCIVPPLRVLNPIMTFGRCFLKFPYQQMLTLVNDSDLPGCYGVLPQEHKENAAVWYSSPMPCGIIQPRSSVEVLFTLEVQVMGEQDTVAHVVVFGSEGSSLKIHLVSIGEGPVVYVHPSKINFGSIQVLQDASRTLHLSNQAVIPASFRAEMAGKCSRWRIEPSKGVIPSETEVTVTVIANLDDTEKFKDEVNLFIENSHTCVIPVQAVGIGTTIVTDKPFAPELNLGPHFSLDPCCYRFKITNKGRRTHQLYWTTEGFSPFHQRDRLPAISNTKGKDSSQSHKPACPVFKLRPLRMELMPGKTMEMMLEGSSSTPQVVKERLLCHAIVGSKAGKAQIMQVDVTCEFVAPVLQMSSREITFRVEKQPTDVLTLQYKPLSLKNISSLPLNIVLALEQPFLICDADRQPLPADVQPMKLEIGEELHLSVRFNPAYEEDLNIWVAEKALKIQFLEHPHEEQVTIRGEVYFPNLCIQTTALDFGCILNDTEDVRYIEMTNCSPLIVQYHWSFLTDSRMRQIRFSPPAPKFFIKPQLSKEEGAWLEGSASAESSSSDGGVEESAEALGSAGDPAQEPADACDSLEAKPLPSTAAELEGAAETQSLVRIKEWRQFMEAEALTLGVEEVFDVLPLYGVLQPGESQRVTFTFFGHANIVARVMALCRVEGGPTYEIALSGEASLINYLLDVREIDCGLQLFNEVTEAEVTLQNSGKLGFTYVVLSPSVATADSPLPGVPLVVPSTGYIGPGKEQVLKVYYLPGVPGVFCRTFQIQVGHLEPEEISLKGEGSFPRIYLDLPRNIKGNEKYEKILKEAKENMEEDSQRDEGVVLGEAAAAEPPTDDLDTMVRTATFNTRLQMQMEQMLIEEHALEQQKALASSPPEDTAFDQRARRRLLKAELPEYVLDFGYVILGNIHTHIVKITNTGRFPVSFHTDGRVLCDTGFSMELDHVKHLPYCETETFEVRFDPQSANLPLGEVDVLLPIKVAGGPTFHIRLRANVTVPSLCLSRDRLEFSAVQCGQCQEETVQLHNQLQVPCKWFITMNEPVKKVDKHLPARMRRKLLQELKAKPCVFEALPSAGVLAPGQRCNVRVRFSPMEEKSYRNELKINICQSSQHLQLQVLGHGLEPQLEFNPSVLALGPLLPYSRGVEGTVVVKNPCEFPIEFYSLEFDQQYLAEEQILRMLKDYDCHNTLLLPPRAPGEKLPPEVLEYCQEQRRLQDEQAKSKTGESAGQDNANFEDVQSLSDQGGKHSAGIVHTTSSYSSIVPSSIFDESQSNKVDSKSECGEEEEESAEKRHGMAEHRQSTSSSKEAAGELDDSPVYRAIARHLGIDISAEGHAARNRRGIVIIVHGAPLTGKTSAAVALSKHYGAACLSIDAMVTEAISDRSSSAGLRARELCIRAAIEQSHKETEDAGKEKCQNADVSLSLQFSAEAKCSPDVSQSSSGDKVSLQSISSRGRASAAVGKRKTDGRASQSQKQHLTGSQGSSSSYLLSPLPCVPAQRWLSISGSTAGELGFMSCVLPEDLLVAILSERLQLSDCYQGVVFDGLETLFACNIASALLCLLKAVRYRPHIYFVNLFQDYASLKARETAAKEQEGREREEAARREKARLWEMDEDEYDALTEEQKTQFNNNIRQVQRERKKREMEQLARELEEKHQRELERLKEEEELKKKLKRGKRELGKDKDNASGKKSQPGVRQNMNTSNSNTNASISNRSDVTEGVDKKGSVKEHPDSVAGDKEDKKKQSKVPLTEACPAVVVQPTDPEQGEAKNEVLSDSEKDLALRFKIYEASQKDVTHILSYWDRVQGILLSPLNQEEVWHQAEDQRQHLPSRRSRKDREKERQERLEKERAEKEHLEKEQLEKLKALEDSKLSQLEGEGAEEGSARGQDVGVPCLDIQVLSSDDVTRKILESSKLPSAEQILDGLGLGPSGPPVPPTTFYSVIHYPEKRMAPEAGEALKHFVFVVPEGATTEDEKKDTESLVDAPIVATVKMSEQQVTPTRGRSRKEKAVGSREAVKEKRGSGRGRRRLQEPGTGSSPWPPRVDQSGMDTDPFPGRSVRLSSCRWIVPAHGEVELKVHFSSTVVGQFDQTLHFEVLGTNRLYQLHCRGTCLYPTISQDPRLVFPHWRKSKADDDIIFKQYVMNTGVFHFGPLLCGKSRDWYKALHYPSNCEKITILNVTPLEAEVHFFFERDLKADTFLLDPPSMRLKPNEKQELSIWAYPTSSGLVEDNLVCCIQENPEPVVFRLCCQGVQVELGVSPKQVHFNKLLLHRRDTKTLVLRNSTPLPVAWRLSGLENLGEDFSVSQDKGTIGPCTEFGVHLYFKATKALSIKKMIRLEVSDAENVLGIVQVENIQILAEAYDVALSISISKGTDGSVDFGILKVLDDAKQVLTLKNKGKYEIAYSFKLETADTNIRDLASHFTIQPQKGMLAVSERPVQVQLLFHPKMEMHIEDKPILHCQVIEPSICEGGETIAIIPVRVSAKAVFSKYSIYPASLISFGAMMNGTRKTCTFTLENKGILDFKFFIYRADQDAPVLPRKSAHHVKSARSHDSENLSKMTPSVKQSKHSLQKDANPFVQARFTLGMFTVYPGFGSIPPGGQQMITVDCYAEPLGTCKEYLSIDISDRDPKDNPLGIPYTLFAESCLPAFVADDIESIFEEHRICSNINLCHILQTVQDKGVFITDENKFIFTNVLVGHRATARFKIRNVGKVPCDMVLSIKPIPGKLNSHISDIFEVDPIRMCVPSCSHAFATVTFTPQTMQNYQCTFQASLDVQASPAAIKAQSLTFDISGDGNLPRVTVLRPVLHNKRGNPLLLFKKLLLGDSEKLPLVLHNGGIVPVQLMIDLLDERGVFFLKARPTTHCIYQAAGVKEDSPGEERKPHTASLVLHHGELAEFDVLFKPTLAQHMEGKIHLSVVDNPYEETNIQLVGEGYEDDFTLDNIRGLVADSENTEGNLEEDIIEDHLLSLLTAARVDHIQFGDCHVGTPYPVTFTITNRSRVEVMRFEWLAGTPFHFSPQVGHLHAGCAKDITVTLKSDIAVAFKMHPVKCKVARIAFQLPPEQVTDWDDRLRTVKWVDATRGPAATWPVKKKVIETDPEPAHTVLEKSSREVELRLSAVVDYAEFKLDTDMIQFKETLLFQTRTFSFQLSNTGNVALEYTWMAAVEDKRAVSCTGELLPPSLDGDFLSSTSGASVKLQSSRCSSQLGRALEHVSSSLRSSLNTVSATSLFAVEPCSGTIPAGQEQLFQMKFSPVYVGDFESRMVCSIPNLKANQKGPEVVVRGRSLMPNCHFELEDSDYITAQRRNPELQGPKGATLDLNTRVIEFAATGVYSRNSRTFVVMNPTGSAYSFQWTCQDPEFPPEQVAFFCLTERGQIQPGKKTEMKFEFIPRHLDITESFWVFTIPEQSISVPFLLVGNTTDPLVTLDRSHLNFHLLLIGHEVHQTIYMINSEKEAFSFTFRESSFFSEGYNTSVKIEPLEGSVAPLSRLPVTVFFTPTLEGEVVFNLKCDVKRKTQPLSLNIKATGYSMNVSVRCEDSDGRVTELSAREINVIDFKEVQLNENIKRIFSIHNNSKFSFTFSWELSGPAACKQVLTITPQTGAVRAEGKAETQLAFHPQKMCSLKDVELILQISKGPTFTCVFLATVVVPTVRFSTTRLNFGACFIYHAGMPPARQTLVITNKADKDISLNCLFTSTAHLEVDFPGYILCPGGTVEVPITFYPREVASYNELIPFEINGLYQQTVEVRGRGTEMKVDVVEPQGKVVKLGALSIGQTVKKIVTIANNSAAPLTFKLSLTSTTPELQEAGVLCLNPTNELSLKPKGDSCKVEVTFSPKCRIQPFTEEVMLECNGLVLSLFMVRGSCQGIHVSLDQEHLSFGAVVQQSYTSQRIIMQNMGDIGVKFKWDIESFKPDFSISPTKGYISPGMDVAFVVTFRPSKLSHVIQYEGLQCFIQGSEPLRLTLAGCCMETPVTKETLTFACDVREKHSQTILLSNPSNEAWTVQPVIEGEHWKGPEFFHLEANQQNKPYKITYKPLTMSLENKKHQGSIFFPLPDGTGLYYLLQGTAEAPKCSGTIFRQVPCRTSYTELIPVSNWLNRPQRFLVVVDILKPENVESSSVLQGLEYIDVPGSAKKDYKLTFLSYKEGVFSTMVTFLNEVTKEYLFYIVTFKATASGPISTVEMTTAVRQRMSSTVTVDNPLPVPVTFAIDCKVPDVNVPPHFTVPAQSEADLVFEYQPLKMGESTGRLVLQSSDLGSFYYNLDLKATTSRPEKPLYFCTTLGSSQTITTKIMNYTRQKTEYLLQTNSADFQTEKTISVAPASSLRGSEMSVEVTYEPCQLGEARAMLQLSSPLGGEYSIPLFGLALPPKPQGPFPIKAGGTTSIPFKNVFLQPTAFQYTVEHPAFAVRGPESLRSKKTTFITVSFEGGPAPVTSKMVVSCPRAAGGSGAGVSWVYYLRGLPPHK